MIRALVTVFTPDERIEYSAIGKCTADMISAAIDQFGLCSVIVKPL